MPPDLKQMAPCAWIGVETTSQKYVDGGPFVAVRIVSLLTAGCLTECARNGSYSQSWLSLLVCTPISLSCLNSNTIIMAGSTRYHAPIVSSLNKILGFQFRRRGQRPRDERRSVQGWSGFNGGIIRLEPWLGFPGTLRCHLVRAAPLQARSPLEARSMRGLLLGR